jgi:protein involved in polysaccharide export with SLBB domain
MSTRGHRAVFALGSITTIATLMTIATLLAGCASNEARGPAAFVMPAAPQEQGEYILQPGDAIDVSFYFHPDNNQANLLVRPDGKIYLPLIGEVQAAGLTAPQVAEAITKRSAVNLRDPKVAVNVRTLNPTRVFIGGEVFKPGFVTYTPGLTAVQATMQVGGWKDTANLEEVVLLQKTSEGSNEYRPSKINLGKVVELGDTKADIVLGPSDVLVFPKTGIAKANLWVQQYIINLIPIRISASPF